MQVLLASPTESSGEMAADTVIPGDKVEVTSPSQILAKACAEIALKSAKAIEDGYTLSKNPKFQELLESMKCDNFP
ncbi:hypothetical protein [Limimaricola sp. AA108-03]|uniref:hypothetical protein n=1 Tax=Limimaricola sp. AA108-03 TaxID=3425945 RepID=UPI003D773253